MSAHRALLKAGRADLSESDVRVVLGFLVEWLIEHDDELADLTGVLARLGTAARQPRTAKTRIPHTERNPSTMAIQIQDNDTTKRIEVAPGTYQDALGVPIATDPAVTPSWSSSNPAVATVDPATGAIAPVHPVTLGVTTTITGTAANADGTQITLEPQDVEIIAGPPATANTQIV